jgi:hypothetical protein
MAQSQQDLTTVVFQCDARGMYVRKSLYIAGNHEELGSWLPNKVRLFNDGSHGDAVADDNIWSVEIPLPVGAEIEYKYTNSGAMGNWSPGEEFSSINRRLKVEKTDTGKMLVQDKFGML